MTLLDTDDEDNLFLDGTILGIQRIISYNSCSNKKCRNKKLDGTLKCPRCSQSYTEATLQKAYVSNMCLLTSDDEIKNMTFFSNTFTKIFGINQDDLRSADEMTTSLSQLLPKTVKYQANMNNVVEDILVL